MDDILKILNDDTLTSEKKAEQIKALNQEITDKAIKNRLERAKEKSEKEQELIKEKAEREKAEKEKDLNATKEDLNVLNEKIKSLEAINQANREDKFKTIFGDKDYKEAMEKEAKGYDIEDLKTLYKVKPDKLGDFEEDDNKDPLSKLFEREEQKPETPPSDDKHLEDVLNKFLEFEKTL